MIEFSRALHFVLLGAYLILVASFFIVVRPRFRGPNLVYLIMCLLNVAYTTLTIAGTFGPYKQSVSVAIVLVAACLGFSSLIAFTKIMEFLIGANVTIRYLKTVVQLGVAIFALSLIELAWSGTSWTVRVSEVGYVNPFFALMLPGLEISPLGKLTLGTMSFAGMLINLIILRSLITQPCVITF